MVAQTSVRDKERTDKIIAYHSTNSYFLKFANNKRDLGFHFGTREQAIDRGGKLLLKVELRILNPLHLSDLGQWSDMDMLREYLTEINEGPFTNLEFQAFINVNDVRNALTKKGYDGIIYENAFEAAEDIRHLSHIAFKPEQIKILEYFKIFNDTN